MGLNIIEFNGLYKVTGHGFSVTFTSRLAMESALPQLRKKHRVNIESCAFDITQGSDDEIRKEEKR